MAGKIETAGINMQIMSSAVTTADGMQYDSL
jgi:hypothetical protein